MKTIPRVSLHPKSIAWHVSKLRVVTERDRPVLEYMLNEHVAMLAPSYLKLNANPFYAKPRNVGFITPDDFALALFESIDDLVYGAHLICDPPWRGAAAIAFGRAAVGRVFTDHGAKAILAEVPRENRASRIVCRAIGGIPGADTADENGRPCILYRLAREAWEQSSAASSKA